MIPLKIVPRFIQSTPNLNIRFALRILALINFLLKILSEAKMKKCVKWKSDIQCHFSVIWVEILYPSG
jgi:hypothetical protein